MKLKTFTTGLTLIALFAAAGYGGYSIGIQRGMRALESVAPGSGQDLATAPAAADPSVWTVKQGEEATRRHIKAGLRAGRVDPVTGRKIIYYHDPMVPGKNFEAPGKSPFMDMMLVPVYAGSEAVDSGTVAVSPRIRQNIGLRTAPVIEGSLAEEISAVGTVVWNERDQAMVQARAKGFVEKLHVRAALDPVAKDQPLVELYVPDWIAAQEEFLALRNMQGEGIASLEDAARARMRQAGMDEAAIRLVQTTGKPQTRAIIWAPNSGVLTELMAHEGMTVLPGMTLARINGNASVWAHAEVPESQAAQLRPGLRVRADSPAFPGKVFKGRIQALLPEVDPSTRTLKVRMELANPDGRLVPGMFVRMRFEPEEKRKMLLVPTEAVIQTGRRTLIMLAEEEGRFRPQEVEIGLEAKGQTEIKQGLHAGQNVVLSGQFLVDSEASLKGIEARLNEQSTSAPLSLHRTSARIEAIRAGRLTLTHPAIPSLNWPSMTMDFVLPSDVPPPKNLTQGQEIEIAFKTKAGEMPQIVSVKPAQPSKNAGGKP